MNSLIYSLAVLASAPAAAAAGEGAGGAAKANPAAILIPVAKELIPALFSFAIVFFVLSKYAWPAISEMLDKRAMTIKESLESAEAAKIEAERLLTEYKAALAEARKEASTVLQQAKQAAESTRSEASARAQAEYDAMLGKAREAIEGEKQAAIQQLQTLVADISVDVAGKLIGSELSREQHLEVIEKYVSEAGSLNAN